MGEKSAFRIAAEQASARAGAVRIDGPGMVLHAYPDYETYRAVQTEGNRAKLECQFVNKGHVERLSNHLIDDLGVVRFGICHGTRRGKEQRWFRKLLGHGAEVLGTEISDTATTFPNTVQWDFHDPNPDWEGRADFVYSNSWDHAFDPARAFRTWAGQLRPGGVLLLDHTRDHGPGRTDALDPFGATIEALTELMSRELRELGHPLDPLDYRNDDRYPARVVRFRRT